jgi:hypothetical protein
VLFVSSILLQACVTSAEATAASTSNHQHLLLVLMERSAYFFALIHDFVDWHFWLISFKVRALTHELLVERRAADCSRILIGKLEEELAPTVSIAINEVVRQELFNLGFLLLELGVIRAEHD